MKRVYIVQNPMRRDKDTQQLVQMYDLTAAREYGNLEVLLPSGPVLLTTADATSDLREKLGSFDSSDHLLCLGDPVAIAAASAVVASITGGVIPLLVWDRKIKRYLSVRIDIFSSVGAH